MWKILLCLLVSSPVFDLLAQSSSSPATATMSPARVQGGDDLRKLLSGTKWSWKPDGMSESEITFSPDGKVLHNAFTARYYVRSRSDVELQWDRKVATLKFAPTYTSYEGTDFGGARLLHGELRGPNPATPTETASSGYFGSSKGGVTTTTPIPTNTPVVDPGIELDLKRLATQHGITVAAAVAPINQSYKTALEPLLKRAQQAGNLVMVEKIKNLMAAQNNLDGTSWRHHGNAWVVGLRFSRGIMSVLPGGGGTRDTAYQVGNDNMVRFNFDGVPQEIILAPDRTSLKWAGIPFDLE